MHTGYYDPYQEKYESVNREPAMTEKMKLDNDVKTAFINVLHTGKQKYDKRKGKYF